MVGDGRPSGGTTVVLSLARDLAAKKNWHITVVSQEGSYALEEAQKFGLQARGIDFFQSRLNFKAVRQLKEVLAELKPELIHAHAARAAFPLSYAVSSPRSFPIVYTVHSYHFLGKGMLMRHLGSIAERRCHCSADASTFVCKYDENIANEWSLLPAKGLTRQIYNGIEAADFPEPAKSDGQTIIFFGNLIHQKNPQLFVEMAALVAAKHPNLNFKMVGGGDLRSEVEGLIEKFGLRDRFELTGRIPREEALAAVNGSHIMVMPSRWEGAPVVILEAMYLGVPIIGSNFPAMTEFLVHEETGLVVKEQTGEAYAQALEGLLQKNELHDHIVGEGKKRVREQFLREQITDKYIALYEELLHQKEQEQ